MDVSELLERQHDELEVLKAIFMDDFEFVKNKTAWKVFFFFWLYDMRNGVWCGTRWPQ